MGISMECFHETRTGLHINIISGHDKQEISVLLSECAWVQLFPMFSCRVSLQGQLSKAKKCFSMHTGDKSKGSAQTTRSAYSGINHTKMLGQASLVLL